MEDSSLKQYEMPLHLQLAMRKAELASEEMTWDQMRVALLNLYSRRLMELQAVKDILEGEGVDVEFNIPSDIELQELEHRKKITNQGCLFLSHELHERYHNKKEFYHIIVSPYEDLENV